MTAREVVDVVAELAASSPGVVGRDLADAQRTSAQVDAARSSALSRAIGLRLVRRLLVVALGSCRHASCGWSLVIVARRSTGMLAEEQDEARRRCRTNARPMAPVAT